MKNNNDLLEEKIKELKNKIEYEERRNEVCATSKSDLYYLDSLKEELEKLKEKADCVDGICCPICEEELTIIPFEDEFGNITYIYSHDNTCPFIAFEYVNDYDLKNFVKYIKRGVENEK